MVEPAAAAAATTTSDDDEEDERTPLNATGGGDAAQAQQHENKNKQSALVKVGCTYVATRTNVVQSTFSCVYAVPTLHNICSMYTPFWNS